MLARIDARGRSMIVMSVPSMMDMTLNAVQRAQFDVSDKLRREQGDVFRRAAADDR